ncbi:DUF2752 domain-containing protein [Pedobacter sp. R-06]|uniref:DUF2752 domain-containing protein n=1 Tax=Pedobacter sp. R-06 TaxID=3404051 RepID=UPI003CEA0C17
MAQPQHSFLDWIGEHLFTCPFRAYLGFDCPGCGLQRSVLALFRGDLMASIKFYPATIPLIFVMLFTIVHLKVDFKFGAQLIKIVFACVAVIILINYIYKIYTHQLI